MQIDFMIKCNKYAFNARSVLNIQLLNFDFNLVVICSIKIQLLIRIIKVLNNNDKLWVVINAICLEGDDEEYKIWIQRNHFFNEHST